jgi:hypothetical protein
MINVTVIVVAYNKNKNHLGKGGFPISGYDVFTLMI